MPLQYILIVLALLVFSAPPIVAQPGLTPATLTNTPLGSLNDASAVGWNPSLLGITSGYDFLLALPYGSKFNVNFKNGYAAFGKFGPLAGGIITPPENTLGRDNYYVGTGFNVIESRLWAGFGVRWLEGGGFFKSAEYTLAATLRPLPRLLTSLTIANLSANNDAGIRVDAHGAYRVFDWLRGYAGIGYDGDDTLAGRSELHGNLGIGLNLLNNGLLLSAGIDPFNSSYRLGAEIYFGEEDNSGGGTIADWADGEMSRGVLLARYASIDEEEAEFSGTSITTTDVRGWAPDRAYVPVGLSYKYSTTDAAASGDALVRPCDGSGAEYDSPAGLLSVLSRIGAPYTGLSGRLQRISPTPNDLYKNIRRDFYTSRIRNSELRSGDSLALLSRQGYSLGIQSVDVANFPRVSMIMQVTDNSGTNVRGLGAGDFAFRDTSLKILSVKQTDSSFSVPVDIVLIVDCSGSMKDEIEAVRTNVESFVNTMQTRGADYRIGGVLYGSMIYDTLHPTSDLDNFKEFAANAAAIGGDEITSLALKTATEMNFRPGSQRAFILITDDWAIQDNAALTEPDLTDMLWNTGARLYVIGDPCHNNSSVMTRLSLGREYDIKSPFNSILDNIGADVTTQYELVYESRVRQEEVAPKVTILRGKLRDETGRPAPVGMTLTGGSGTIPPVAVNQTTGEYEVEIAEGNVYTASISGGRYLPLTERVDLTAAKQGDVIVRDFTLRLPPTVLAGQVTDDRNTPVSAEVRIEDAATGRRVLSVRSGSDGRYETLLPEGSIYRIEAVNPDYIPTPVELDARGVERGTRMTQDLKVTSIETAIANGQTFKVKNIFFDFAKWSLKPESFPELDRLVALLNEYPRINVEIGAHTDAIGNDRDNQTLSENRAKSVVDYLIGKGIAETRLRAKGYGKTVPIASNDTDEGRALNRRVEFKLVR